MEERENVKGRFWDFSKKKIGGVGFWGENGGHIWGGEWGKKGFAKTWEMRSVHSRPATPIHPTPRPLASGEKTAERPSDFFQRVPRTNIIAVIVHQTFLEILDQFGIGLGQHIRFHCFSPFFLASSFETII